MHRAHRSLRLVALALALVAPAAAAQPSAAIDLLRRAPTAEARVRAAEAVGRLRPSGARSALESALADRAPAVRVACTQALEALGDPAAIAALNRHAFDPDARTRDAVLRALQSLSRRTPASPSTAWAPAAGAAPAAAPPSAPAAEPPGRVNWRRVRVLMTVGPLGNSATADPAHVQHLRDALRASVGQDERYALHPGALPSAATSRLRRGDLRLYSLQGGLTTLREDRPGRSLSVRAEVSLVLVTEPSHAIAATIAGAATAQETPPLLAGLPDPLPRLRQRAIEGAVHGAVRSLEDQLLPGGRR